MDSTGSMTVMSMGKQPSHMMGMPLGCNRNSQNHRNVSHDFQPFTLSCKPLYLPSLYVELTCISTWLVYLRRFHSINLTLQKDRNTSKRTTSVVTFLACNTLGAWLPHRWNGNNERNTVWLGVLNEAGHKNLLRNSSYSVRWRLIGVIAS